MAGNGLPGFEPAPKSKFTIGSPKLPEQVCAWVYACLQARKSKKNNIKRKEGELNFSVIDHVKLTEKRRAFKVGKKFLSLYHL